MVLKATFLITGQKLEEILRRGDVIMLRDHVINLLLSETARIDQELDKIWPIIVLQIRQHVLNYLHLLLHVLQKNLVLLLHGGFLPFNVAVRDQLRFSFLGFVYVRIVYLRRLLEAKFSVGFKQSLSPLVHVCYCSECW